MKVWVPRDAAAKALGAEDVVVALQAEAARRGIDLSVIRNGSRGMVWLEPLVELETPEGRVGFGPLEPADVPALFDAPGAHPKALGLVEELPFFSESHDELRVVPLHEAKQAVHVIAAVKDIG